MEVAILYVGSDEPIWKSLSEVDDFRKDGVLAITLTNERGNRLALFDRMWSRQNRYDNERSWHGGDNYAIGIWGDRFFCDQWDDHEDHLHIRKIIGSNENKGEQLNLPRPSRWPVDANVTQFRGEWVPVVDWHRAIEILEDEMF